MSDAWNPEANGMRLVGRATPGAPCGDIYVSEALLAHKGGEWVRRMVREEFSAAYRAHDPRSAQEGKQP